ncbi:MAG: pilus assembly protein [Acidimicrobiaceae bacterium]|jgi:hypothetical protein|nr:pilus assembly protein [Acidimicrobiaceae bacterium]MBT5581448.1 pilus assembly protein [Acidimicrobiaceae bacterium]MBT5851710.1 pilus assembly protein [Acidimicrobiaceae bacterium]
MFKGAKTESKKGQATVELALLLPFFALLLMAIIQVGLVVHARVLVTHAAREGARAAAVGASDEEIRQAVAVAGDLPVHRLRVEVARVNGAAVVSVYYVDPTVVPLIGAMLSDVELAATATMRLE